MHLMDIISIIYGFISLLFTLVVVVMFKELAAKLARFIRDHSLGPVCCLVGILLVFLLAGLGIMFFSLFSMLPNAFSDVDLHQSTLGRYSFPKGTYSGWGLVFMFLTQILLLTSALLIVIHGGVMGVKARREQLF